MDINVLSIFTSAVEDLTNLVPEVEAFVAKEASEAASELKTAETAAVTDLQALLAEPSVANFIAAAKALDPQLVSEIEALLAKIGV
jgi:ABC-type histidine transport system ATPase subunit